MHKQGLVLIAKQGACRKCRRLVFTVYELVACLAQYHKPMLVQVIIVCFKPMVYIQVAHTFIFDAAKLARHITGGAHIPPEHLPNRCSAEFCAFFSVRDLYTHSYMSA